VWVNNREIKELSENIRKIIDGQNIDLRDNREGVWSILKNDIHTLASLKNERAATLGQERDAMAETLTNISHQLKTPLTSMMIMADLLDFSADNSDKQAEFIANIKTGLVRMEWLASALLKMAKLDAGMAEFSKEPIQAAALVALALEPLQILLEVKEQNIEVNCDIELLCDKRWTAEALINVIKNAMEYSPKGGKIRIEAGMNPICRWVSVTDSGAGIPKAKIAGLFKRFEASQNDKGHGIGLPLALAIMHRQGGDIEVDGGNGKSATFVLKFYGNTI